MERLTEKWNGKYLADVHDYENDDGGLGHAIPLDNVKVELLIQKLSEYEDLEEQGLLVKLPCKVGDTVYILDRDGKPRKMILDAPDIRCHCAKEDNLCMALCDSKNTGICAYRFKNDGSDIGKTIFLTQAEAEEARRRLWKI